MLETIVRVPVTGPVVLDEPLFVYGCAIGDGGVVGNRQVFDEDQVVDAICGVDGGGWNDDRWQRRGLNHNDILRRVDDQRGFDELRLGCGRDERRLCGEGEAG